VAASPARWLMTLEPRAQRGPVARMIPGDGNQSMLTLSEQRRVMPWVSHDGGEFPSAASGPVAGQLAASINCASGRG
jgi:hypothetical protein